MHVGHNGGETNSAQQSWPVFSRTYVNRRTVDKPVGPIGNKELSRLRYTRTAPKTARLVKMAIRPEAVDTLSVSMLEMFEDTDAENNGEERR